MGSRSSQVERRICRTRSLERKISRSRSEAARRGRPLRRRRSGDPRLDSNAATSWVNDSMVLSDGLDRKFDQYSVYRERMAEWAPGNVLDYEGSTGTILRVRASTATVEVLWDNGQTSQMDFQEIAGTQPLSPIEIVDASTVSRTVSSTDAAEFAVEFEQDDDEVLEFIMPGQKGPAPPPPELSRDVFISDGAGIRLGTESPVDMAIGMKSPMVGYPDIPATSRQEDTPEMQTTRPATPEVVLMTPKPLE